MRIKTKVLGDTIIEEVNKVIVKKDEIVIGLKFYQTKDKTKELAEKLLKEGYADFSNITCI